MLRNVARQSKRWRPLPPRTRLAISQLYYRNSTNACHCHHPASSGAALQPLLIEHRVATNRPRPTTHLPNDGTLEQQPPHWVRDRNQATCASSFAQKSSTRPLEYMAASHLLQKVLGGANDAQDWRRRVARCRSIRLPVVLLQEIIRQSESESESESGESSDVMQLLPTEKEMGKILKHPSLAMRNREALDYYIYVLRGRDDEERCRRYLEKAFLAPEFVFHFLVRPSADFSDTSTLLAMIDSCESYFDGAERAKMKAKTKTRNRRKFGDGSRVQMGMSGQDSNIDHANFNLMLRLLVAQCLRLEPRFVVLLAQKASRYIVRLKSRVSGPRKLFLRRCNAFNGCLEIFRPQPRLQTVQQSMPNVYFWEAQRVLLTMSAGLAKPLLISKAGFQAIRDVLSGQPKNCTEVRSAARHAPGWPPYLLPGHGMDELSDPEDNRSRSVSAGMLMQEAGYSKDHLDAAVDILQGMDVDGTPTIQQRSAIDKARKIGVWEASIRATRNAQEAWGRFKHPPQSGSEPGLGEYAAMFEKLVRREAEPGSSILPGDKALNFPTQHEANLTEFAKARLCPPSVSELYQDMKLAGVRPEGVCLRILVANADSLDMAHQYLLDSPGEGKAFQCFRTDEPDRLLLTTVPLGLFAAYIQVCVRAQGPTGNNQLMRAIRLAEARLQGIRSRWMPFVWGIILKDLSQHFRALRISLTDQLGMFSRVADAIGMRAGLQLSSFTQFNKCVRKTIQREVNMLFASDLADNEKAQRGFVRALYGQTWACQGGNHRNQHGAEASEPGPDGPWKKAKTAAVLDVVGSRMKTMFWSLAQRERDVQRHLQAYPIAVLDRLSCRRDAVRSGDVHEYMLALGYLGRFDEMARLLDWLMEEWGEPDVASALRELDDSPPYADFLGTLCVFRLVAEPMLGRDVVTALVRKMADSGLEWTWPDDETVESYAELHNHGSIRGLWRAVKWARRRRGQ